MSSPLPLQLTDNLWLTAHDQLRANGDRKLGAKPFGLGLAAGLLAELIMCKSLTLEAEQLHVQWVGRRHSHELVPQPVNDQLAPALGPVLDLLADADRRQNGLPQHRQGLRRTQGQPLRDWMSYLAVARPPGDDVYPHLTERGCLAEELVLRRLSRTGCVVRERHRRLFGAAVERMMPRNANVSGTPANRISTRLKYGEDLETAELLLASLIVATSLHPDVLSTVGHQGWVELDRQLKGLSVAQPMLDELLQVAESAIGDAAMAR